MERRDHEIIVTARRRVRTDVRPRATRLDVTGSPADDISFRVRADGVWTARFVADPADEVRLICGTDRGPQHGEHRLVSDVRGDISAETQVAPERGLDLISAAEATGGVHQDIRSPSLQTPTAAGGSSPVTVTPLWTWCLLLSLVAYLLDIAWRRSHRRRPVGA